MLLTRLGKDHPSYLDVLGFQSQLIENIENTRKEETPELRYKRTQILEQLNRISEVSLSINFNELCFSDEAQNPRARSLREANSGSQEPSRQDNTLQVSHVTMAGSSSPDSEDIASNLGHPAWQGLGAIATIILGIVGIILTVLIALIQFGIIDIHSILP